MSYKRLALLAAALSLAAAIPVAPAGASPESPGACHMMRANAHGIAGMQGASDQGFGNMIDLVLASLATGCSP